MQTSLLREQKITVTALVADNKSFWKYGKWER